MSKLFAMTDMVVITGTEFRTELKNLLRGEIDEALARVKSNSLNGQDNQLLKRSDLAKMFGVSLVTIHAWMNAGNLPFHRIGGRVFFKRDEVMESLKKIKLRKK